MLVHHVKGQPPASTYVREKVGVTCDTNRETPCSFGLDNQPRLFEGTQAQLTS